MRIRTGPNRGLRWSVVSAGRGAMAGTFEHERVDAITSMIRDGDCVWDVGAHKGYVTLAMSAQVGAAGHVYAFEPAPPNIKYLRRHVAWNDRGNIEIMPFALSATDGTAQFGGSGSSITYKLGQGAYNVQVRSIASLLKDGLRRPDIIKLDVEGNEAEILRGAGNALRSNMLVFVAIHSYDQYRACTATLQATGFRVVSSRAVARLLRTEPVVWEADPDILAIGPDRHVDAAALQEFSGAAAQR